MSNQFYSYLSKQTISFFSENPLKPGDKYNIQFENKEEVHALYDDLKRNSYYKKYEYKDQNGEVKYESYQLNFPGVKLIVAATIDNIQPDFLTRLRNMVGIEPEYEDKAILFIHDTNLDSIIGGTESFSKEGMPFHINSIKQDIQKKLSVSEFNDVERYIINLELENKQNDLLTDRISVFEYQELLEIIDGTHIPKSKYKNFGLFFDSGLKNLKGKKLRDEIEDNLLYYSRVDDIHNYGNPKDQLEKYFDERGVEKLKREDWKDIDYNDVKKSVEEKKKITPLTYISSNVEWDRPEGNTPARLRNRNMIIFNENKFDLVDLEIQFDGFLKKEFLKVTYNHESIDIEITGKKIKATIIRSGDGIDFYKATYKNDKGENFQFNIVMLECSPKYLEAIKTRYSVVIQKRKQYIGIKTNDSKVVLNEYAQKSGDHKIEENNTTIKIKDDEALTLKISDDFEYDSDKNLIQFTLSTKQCEIPMEITGTSEKNTVIEGLKLWKLKRETKRDFVKTGENRLQHGTREYHTRDEFRKNLMLEEEIIRKNRIYFIETSNGLEPVDLDLNHELESSYKEILNYFRISKKLPSLTHLNGGLKTLYKNFTKEYIKELEKIEKDSYFKKKQKDLLKIGMIKRVVGDKELIMTPLHPLNIIYQLQIEELFGCEMIEEEIVKKFTSTYLLPYILEDNKKLYIPMEQHHSPGWKYYVEENLPRYKGSRDYVSKLVSEKIEEFVGHFQYLFNMGKNAPIRINLINTGDSKEILQGIFKYYVKQLKLNKTGEVLPIDLFIYSKKNITSVFEEVAFNDDIEDLKETYGLNLKVAHMSEEDVLNLYRNKVHFYAKDISGKIEYAHITFLEMENDAEIINSNMDHIPSGVMLDGLISGVPSVFLGDSYRTGFGTKYVNLDNDLMKMAIYLNAANCAVGGDPYDKNKCKAISIKNEKKEMLDNIYNASHWVTFIDPKVDLNFFKNDPEAMDLLIIHYSDQYTTAGGYDAITVTRKSSSYQRVIEEFLEQKGIKNSAEYSPAIINMFNAINGDWLLRLLSSKSHFPKEKISILSAIKLALAKFKKESFIWVPISLEEVLRVSGGAGLKQSEGLFSTKNLGFDKNGVTSDDILLVGIEKGENDLLVHFYPVEVKIGENSTSYIKKGIEQVKATRMIFNKTLLPNENGVITNTQKVYRNFLMQLVITSAEKLELYNICKEEGWRTIIDSNIRKKLLNEEYRISESVDHVIGEAAVISFKRGSQANGIDQQKEGVTIIEMSEDDGVNFITKNVKEIRKVLNEDPINEVEFIKGNSKTNGDDSILKNHDYEGDETDEAAVTIMDTDDQEHIIKEKSEHVQEKTMRILFGKNVKNNTEVHWCPNDTNETLHTNTGIIGTMGTGKTQFTKSMITQIYKQTKYNVNKKSIGILVFDYKGDYNESKQDFMDATNAKVFKLYNLPFNPLSITKTVNSKPMLPLHVANGLKETLAKAFGLGIKQETYLRDLIMEAYENKGIIKNKPDTWGLPAPTLKDVYDIYISKEDLKQDSLYATFSNLIEFEIFEPDTSKTESLFDLIDGVTVIDLSGYDQGIQNLIVAITLDLFYMQMQAYGHSEIDGHLRQLNKMILVDEADNFLSKDFASLRNILKEGREFGVGTILSTQLLSHFSTSRNDYANYILTWVIHKVDDITNRDVKYIFNTQTKQEEDKLFNNIKNLNKHYSVVKTGSVDRAIYMKDKAFWELIKEETI